MSPFGCTSAPRFSQESFEVSCGWTDGSPFAARADQWEDARPTCGKKRRLDICVYPLVRSPGLYLPQSNTTSTGEVKGSRMLSGIFATSGRTIHFHIHNERTDPGLYIGTNVERACWGHLHSSSVIFSIPLRIDLLTTTTTP